jgi:hypothetical protein
MQGLHVQQDVLMATVKTVSGLGLIQTKLHMWVSGVLVKSMDQGTLTFPDGATYVGEWHDGFMNGQGTFTLADGVIKKGIWKDGDLVEPN